MEPHILFEDNHVLAVDKSTGMLTQPNGGSETSLEELCKQWLKKKYAKPGNVYLHAVHRLDRPVSGIVLFAKTSKALSRLNSALREGKMQKTYRAHVEGSMPEKDGVLVHTLVHSSHAAKIVPIHTSGGKEARLSYKTIGFEEGGSILEIELQTGRYHQIRAQLGASGCPIRGDLKYGSKLPWFQEGIGLRHVRLSFPHPITGNLISISI